MRTVVDEQIGRCAQFALKIEHCVPWKRSEVAVRCEVPQAAACLIDGLEDLHIPNIRAIIVEVSIPLEVEMGKNDRTVYRNSQGQWINKHNGASRASSVHDTQADAQAEARRMLQNSGGGELTTMGVDGKIRSKDTVAPGHDPCPPKDTEH